MAQQDITAVVLAGGLATRLGGVDKGLQLLDGKPLVSHVIERIRGQVGHILINCNRNAERYAAFGYPLVPDRFADFPGPLAGLHAALEVVATPLVMTVPCDAPFLPDDLVQRLYDTLADGDAAIAATDLWQPVFALYRRDLLPKLENFLMGGGRKVTKWQRELDFRIADFADREDALKNLNSAEDWPDGSWQHANTRGTR